MDVRKGGERGKMHHSRRPSSRLPEHEALVRQFVDSTAPRVSMLIPFSRFAAREPTSPCYSWLFSTAHAVRIGQATVGRGRNKLCCVVLGDWDVYVLGIAVWMLGPSWLRLGRAIAGLDSTFFSTSNGPSRDVEGFGEHKLLRRRSGEGVGSVDVQ